MKFLVLGAGRMGYAAVYDLIRSPKVEKVVVADKDAKSVKGAVERLNDPKIVPVELDITKESDVIALMKSVDVAISCVPYENNYELAKAALEAKTHFVDLGGNEDVVQKTFLLNELAKERKITIIPDLGLAPGLVSILAVAAADSFDELYEIRIRVGGLPVDSENFMGYSHVFALEGLINEYAEDVTLIRDGRMLQVPSLSECEKIEFPKPFGVLEAFTTSGGISTLPKTYEGKIQHLDYKTIRYKGHCEQLTLLKELGLMSKEQVKLKGGKVVPRELLMHLLDGKLAKDEPDAVILRVTVTGVKDKEPRQLVWEGIEFSDQAERLSAMMRMTAFPASIIAQMIARGDIKERGVLRQEEWVPVKLFLAELESRGLNLTLNDRAPVPTEK
ncbi:MAG TPA: saccharopine dehydrogenase [Candidatus Melainabacteria bacterium]|nr:saccharopine dehydrogenase [Candidatus Melainabacteria bacterium]HIN64839.1 saccharopine dehydrogenase [Candidatus Obscuribacterales bacterium]